MLSTNDIYPKNSCDKLTSITICLILIIQRNFILSILTMTPTEEDGNAAPRKCPLTETTHEYSEAATIHGIYYIFERGRCAFERFIWIVVVLLALLFAIELSITAYDNWKSNPVLTSVGTTGYPIEQVKFPSITICPQGSANDIIDAALFRQFDLYLKSKNKYIEDLSDAEREIDWEDFLFETYPGSMESPVEMVKMLGSPNLAPDKSIDAKSILHSEDESTCPQKLKAETYKFCPEGFHTITNTTDTDHPKPCWHFAGEVNEMNFELAGNYCQTLDGDGASQLFNFLDRRDYDILWPILTTGMQY